MIDDSSVDAARPDGARHHRFQHEGSGSVATTVALAVADVDGVEPTEMEPLYEAVEPDLLEALCSDDRRVSGDVMFTYRGYRITVDSDGGIVVTTAAGSDES